MIFSLYIELRDSKASTECNFEVGENLNGVGETHDGQTSVTEKIGQTRDGYARDTCTYVTFP